MSAVAYAWQGLWTMRFVRVVAVCAVVLTGAGAALLALALGSISGVGLRPDGMLVTMLRTNVVVPAVAAVLGAAAVGADVRRGAVLPALLRARGRERAWLARLVVACGAGVCLALGCVAVSAVVVAAVAGPLSPADVAATTLGVVGLAVGWALVGAGVGSVLRHQLAAAALPIVLAYVVEPLLRTAAAFGPAGLRPLAQLLPLSAGAELVRGTAATAATVVDASADWQVSAAAFAVAALAVAGGGFAVFRRADLVPSDVA